MWPFSPFPSQTFVSTLVTPPKRTVRRFFKGRRISHIHLNFTGILTFWWGEKKCFFFTFTCVVINRLKCNSSNYSFFLLFINVTILPSRSQIKKKKNFHFFMRLFSKIEEEKSFIFMRFRLAFYLLSSRKIRK